MRSLHYKLCPLHFVENSIVRCAGTSGYNAFAQRIIVIIFVFIYFHAVIVHYVPVTSGNNAFAVRLIVVHLAVATPLICHRLVQGADDNMSHSNQRPFALSSLPAAIK